MPWNLEDYPASFKNLDRPVRKKAIDIANSLLDSGYPEGQTIPIAIQQAKDWAEGADAEELKAVKYGSRPQKSDSHEEEADPDLLDQDVLVYFDNKKNQWQVKTKGTNQASNSYAKKKDALDRAREIASNKKSQVIFYGSLSSSVGGICPPTQCIIEPILETKRARTDKTVLAFFIYSRHCAKGQLSPGPGTGEHR